MEIMQFSIEAVIPILALLVIGYFLKHIGLIDNHMLEKSNKLVFRLFLPVRIFSDVYRMDYAQEFDLKLVFYAIGGVLLSIAIMLLVVPRFVKGNGRRGSVIQAVYRSNYVIYAIALMTNMFGEQGIGPSAMLLPVIMILFNMIGVILLSGFSEKRDANLPLKENLRLTLLEILKNPLIIGSAVGIAFSLLNITIPTAFDKVVTQIGGMGAPFALLLLGAQFDWAKARKNMRLSIIVSMVRLLVMPVLLLTICVVVGGFRGPQLGALFCLFCAPTAVNSYVMAKNMHNDADLAAQLVIMTTLLSSFTIFLGIAILRGLGMF